MTLLSKTVYIDGLDNIVNKYSSTYHSTIKMKPVNEKIIRVLTLMKKVMAMILNLKLLIK